MSFTCTACAQLPIPPENLTWFSVDSEGNSTPLSAEATVEGAQTVSVLSGALDRTAERLVCRAVNVVGEEEASVDVLVYGESLLSIFHSHYYCTFQVGCHWAIGK